MEYFAAAATLTAAIADPFNLQATVFLNTKIIKVCDAV